MKKLILSSAVVFSLVMQGQAPNVQWAKAFGGTASDYCNEIIQTPDGGFIAVGTTSSNDAQVSGSHGNTDIWVIKTDAAGNLQWQQCYGGTSAEEGNAIRNTTDGGYVIAGASASNNGNVSGGHGSNDFWVLKITSTGAVSWQKCFGGTFFEFAQDIQQTADGGYIVAGSTSSVNGDVSLNHGSEDAWILKLDSSGNLQWQRCIGGTINESFRSVIQTQDGSYIAVGVTNSENGDISGLRGGSDILVAKLSAAGTLQWTKTLGGSRNDVAQGILQTATGKYVIAASTLSINGDVSGNQGGTDVWVAQLDASGTIEWQKAIGGPGTDIVRMIKSTTDGGYIIAADSSSSTGDATSNNGNTDFWVVRLDSLGNLEWQKSMGGSSSDSATSVRQTADGGFIVGGSSPSSDFDVVGNHGLYDFWLVKFAPEVLGLPSSQLANFTVSPNPASHYISFPNVVETGHIIDISGRIVKYFANSEELNISELSQGIYSVKGTVAGRAFTIKFIKI